MSKEGYLRHRKDQESEKSIRNGQGMGVFRPSLKRMTYGTQR